MAVQRASVSKTILQMQLNRFYEKPIARVSFALVLSILCIVFFAVAAIKPTLETMAGLIREIDEKKVVDDQLSQKIVALNAAQRELSLHESKFPLLDEAVPTTPRFTQLLTAIEKVASEYDVTLNSMSVPIVPTERVEPDALTAKSLKLESYPITLSFVGRYDQLLLALNELESLRRIILIDRYDIAASQREETNELNMTVAARAFAFQTGQ